MSSRARRGLQGMSKLRADVSISLDGCVAGPGPSQEHPLGRGGERLHEWARAAAGGQDVLLAGGGNALDQYLAAGLVDELQLHVVPLLLGGGTRLFAGLGDVLLEQDRVIAGRAVTHLRYRVPR